MGFSHIANCASLDQFRNPAVVGSCVDLSAHLGDPLFHAGQVAEDSGFFNGVSEGFFAIDMAIGVETECGGRRVGVIRGGDNDAVNVLSVE